MKLCNRKVENTLTLDVKPVRLRDSLYLLIPVDIARLIGVASSSKFLLSISEGEETVRLVYEMRKDIEASPKAG